MIAAKSAIADPDCALCDILPCIMDSLCRPTRLDEKADARRNDVVGVLSAYEN
jgi:hypothetical protein